MKKKRNRGKNRVHRITIGKKMSSKNDKIESGFSFAIVALLSAIMIIIAFFYPKLDFTIWLKPEEYTTLTNEVAYIGSGWFTDSDVWIQDVDRQVFKNQTRKQLQIEQTATTDRTSMLGFDKNGDFYFSSGDGVYDNQIQYISKDSDIRLGGTLHLADVIRDGRGDNRNLMQLFNSPGINAGSIPVDTNRFVVWISHDGDYTCNETLEENKVNQVGILQLFDNNVTPPQWTRLTQFQNDSILSIAVAFGHVYVLYRSPTALAFERYPIDISKDIHYAVGHFDVLSEDKLVYLRNLDKDISIFTFGNGEDVENQSVDIDFSVKDLKITRPWALHTKEDVAYFAVVGREVGVVYIFDDNGNEVVNANINSTSLDRVHIHQVNEETWDVLFTTEDNEKKVQYTQIIQGT